MTDRDAPAALAEDVGRALLAFSRRLRATPPPADEPVALPAPPRTAPAAAVAEDAGPNTAGLGASQRRVLESVRDAGAGGTTSHRVAKETGLRGTNTPRTLKALHERGLIGRWGEGPAVWYSLPVPEDSPFR